MARQPFDRANYVSGPEAAAGLGTRHDGRSNDATLRRNVRRFNYRQASAVADAPTAMQLALMAAARPPDEQRRPGGGGVEAGIGGGVNQQGNDTPTAQHVQRLRELYAGGRGE